MKRKIVTSIGVAWIWMTDNEKKEVIKLENTVLKEKWENTMLEEWQEIRPHIEESVAKLKSHLTVSEAAIQTLSRSLRDFKTTEDIFFLAGCENVADSLEDVIFECVQVIWDCEKVLYKVENTKQA